MKNSICIVGIQINNRNKEAGSLQKVLSQHGCAIRTRLGLHEVADNNCSESGLILIELAGPNVGRDELFKALNGIEGITVKRMEF